MVWGTPGKTLSFWLQQQEHSPVHDNPSSPRQRLRSSPLQSNETDMTALEEDDLLADEEDDLLLSELKPLTKARPFQKVEGEQLQDLIQHLQQTVEDFTVETPKVYHSDEEQELVEWVVETNIKNNRAPFQRFNGVPKNVPEGYHYYPEFEHNGTVLPPRLIKYGGGPLKLYNYRYAVKDTAEKDGNGNIVPKARELQPHQYDAHPDKFLQKKVDNKWKDLVVMQSAGAYMETAIHAVKDPKAWTQGDLSTFIRNSATLSKGFCIEDFIKMNLSHLPLGPTKKYPDSLLDLEGVLKPAARETATNESPGSIASESSSVFEDAQQHTGSPDQRSTEQRVAPRVAKTPVAEALPLDQAAIEGTPMFQLMYTRMKTAEKREREARRAAARAQQQTDSERQWYQSGMGQLIANNTTAVEASKTAVETTKTAVDTNARVTNAYLATTASRSSGQGASDQLVVPNSASTATNFPTKKAAPKPPPGTGAADNYSMVGNQERRVTFVSTFEASNPASGQRMPTTANKGQRAQMQHLSGDGSAMVAGSDTVPGVAAAAAATKSSNISSFPFGVGATTNSLPFDFSNVMSDGGAAGPLKKPPIKDDGAVLSAATLKSGTSTAAKVDLSTSKSGTKPSAAAAAAAAATPNSLAKIADSLPELAEETTKPASVQTGDAAPNRAAFSFQGQSTGDALIKFYQEHVEMPADEATAKVDFILAKPQYQGKEGEVRLLRAMAKKYNVDASVFGLSAAAPATSSGNPGASSLGFGGTTTDPSSVMTTGSSPATSETAGLDSTNPFKAIAAALKRGAESTTPAAAAAADTMPMAGSKKAAMIEGTNKDDDRKVVDSDDTRKIEDGKVAKDGSTAKADSLANVVSEVEPEEADSLTNQVSEVEPEEAAAGPTTEELVGQIGTLHELLDGHLQEDMSSAPELLVALSVVVQNLGGACFVGYDKDNRNDRPDFGELVMIKQTRQVGVVISYSGKATVLLPDGSTSQKQKKSLQVLPASRRNQE